MNVAPRPRIVPPPASVRKRWLVIAFAVAFFAVGAVLWPLPYSQMQLPNSLFGPALAVMVLAAFAARVFGRARFILATAVVGSAAPAAIAARVIVDTTNDPTSHNLWPFELFLGGLVGFACAALGALIAIRWAHKNERR
jgi:hypothetical protein